MPITQQDLRRRVIRSHFGAAAAFPPRAAVVARHSAGMLRLSASWLIRARETMNFSYALSPLNYTQLGWFVAAVTGADIEQSLDWMDELETDDSLRAHVRDRLATNPDHRIGPSQPLWGRRVGWYALVRALRPTHVVETGTALGLGSCIIAAALIRNGTGRLSTIDVDPDAGHLIAGPWAEVVDRYTDDSIARICSLDTVDCFLHDSLHTYDQETAEFEAVAPKLTEHAMLLSDNAHETAALSDWARRTNRRYLFFKELPANHWWTGDGIGVAWWRDPQHGNSQASDRDGFAG